MDIYNPIVHSREDSLTSGRNQPSQELTSWSRNLRKWGLAGLVSTFLENGGPFTTLAAQSLYVCQPLLEPLLPIRSVAQMLEDPEMTRAFVKTLQDDIS